MTENKNKDFNIMPCPHCGGAAGFKIRFVDTQSAYFVQVRCWGCGAQSRAFRTEDIESGTAKADAVSVWNMRV